MNDGGIAAAIVSMVPALVAFGVLALLARGRKSSLWLVPGWLAASALAPVLCTFFAVRQVILAFQAMAMSGGGIAAVSAGLFEAYRPLVLTLYLACALTAVTFAIAIRGVIDDDEEEGTGSVVLVAVLLLVAVAMLLPLGMLQNATGIIMNVLDPNAPQTGGIASTSRTIASRLMFASGAAIAMTLVLLAAVVVTAVVDPKQPPHAGLAKVFAFAALVMFLATVGTTLMFRASAQRFYDSAIGGQPRDR